MKASEIKRTLVLSLVSHFALILPLLVSGCVLRIIKNWIKSSARQYCNLQFVQTAEAEVPNQRSKIDICSSSVGQPNTIGGMPQSNRLAHTQTHRERETETGKWTVDWRWTCTWMSTSIYANAACFICIRPSSIGSNCRTTTTMRQVDFRKFSLTIDTVNRLWS